MIYLKNGRNVNGKKLEILIEEEIIETISIDSEKNIGRMIKRRDNIREINLEGKILMPGIIDIHTHMREPGITAKEDFEIRSRRT